MLERSRHGGSSGCGASVALELLPLGFVKRVALGGADPMVATCGQLSWTAEDYSFDGEAAIMVDFALDSSDYSYECVRDQREENDDDECMCAGCQSAAGTRSAYLGGATQVHGVPATVTGRLSTESGG